MGGFTPFRPYIVYGRHHFDGEDVDELSFRKGEPLCVLEEDADPNDPNAGWWVAQTLEGDRGFVPNTYLTPKNLRHWDAAITDRLLAEGKRLLRRLELQSWMPATVQPLQTNQGSNRKSMAMKRISRIPLCNAARISIMSNTDSFRSSMTLAVGVRDSVSSMGTSMTMVGSRCGGAGGSGDLASDEVLPQTWTPADVLLWLESCGFAECLPLFTEHRIDGPRLLDLTLQGLKDMGVASLSMRIEILHCIESLKGRGSPALYGT
ncbi:hypothetical protein CXG81DRAFT_27415 [Caulochytrium protostelioides]|uniref:SAM domain-containing protein n=1 Tax=Caulochytrium protostelioides TaxID=1555241 RepID=A0A4P9X460_9FUNG|nr:hypothetical protein CXG81DRAFT_27415 [Caulochytrium protostelioides]|eukprot:RKO99847.1 hypothetical protein CXG81DRAFT_27415 [Caulochytrium protostelioides]